MYTTRYTRRCLHQQETVIFFHLTPDVEESRLFLMERIVFGTYQIFQRKLIFKLLEVTRASLKV